MLNRYNLEMVLSSTIGGVDLLRIKSDDGKWVLHEDVVAHLARLDAAFGEIVLWAFQQGMKASKDIYWTSFSDFNDKTIVVEASRLWEQAKEGGE